MVFKSEKQRKGFFAKLRGNIDEFNQKRHAAEQTRLISATKKEQETLNKLKKQVVVIKKRQELKSQLANVKQQEKELRSIKFRASNTGKFLTASKRGIDSAIEFERKHGKGQVAVLQKAGKTLGKQIRKFQ